MIILLKTPKHIVHRLSIDTFIPLSKEPTAAIRSVLSSLRANTCLQTLSPLADSSVDNTLLQSASSVNPELHAGRVDRPAGRVGSGRVGPGPVR